MLFRSDVSFGYIVGDGFNGGEPPDGTEDLQIQYSTNGGSSWFSGPTIWQGGSSNVWTYGYKQLDGGTYTQSGNTIVTGVGTLYRTTLNVGDRVTLGSSSGTLYTVTAVYDNNSMAVTPIVADTLQGLTQISGQINVGAMDYNVSGTGTSFIAQLKVGSRISFNSSTVNTTSFLVTNIIDSSTITISPNTTTSLTNRNVYRLDGVTSYYKLPAAVQFQNTSITVYGPGPTTSIIIRLVQLSQTGIGEDVYAIDNFNVKAYRSEEHTSELQSH